MDLTKLTLDKIDQLGSNKAAAEYFGVKPLTIGSWVASKKVPASAAQKVLDESSGATNGFTPAVATGFTVEQRLANIELRLALIEGRAAQPGVQLVPPKAQPNWTSPHNFGK